ncbi:MAG: hypothetical protein P4L83_03700 [Nevskia sp.]|nr:hypothetical protein [Nevskia sp.]
MAEPMRKRKASGPRTEVFGLRLDPKLKYLAELAARKQRRSLANFLEWSLEHALKEVPLREAVEGQPARSVVDEGAKLWDLDPPLRLVKLAKNYPDLLTYEEQIIWKAMEEIRVSAFSGFNRDREEIIKVRALIADDKNKTVELEALKRCWSMLEAFARGDISEASLKREIQNSFEPLPVGRPPHG